MPLTASSGHFVKTPATSIDAVDLPAGEFPKYGWGIASEYDADVPVQIYFR